MKTLIIAALSCMLAGCGGGSEDGRADVQCNPDSWDCSRMYSDFPFVFVPDTAEGNNIYSFNPAARPGYTLKGN